MTDFDQRLDATGLDCPLPILRCKKALAGMQSGEVINETQQKRYKFTPIPEFMQELVDAGGLIAFAKKEIAEAN